MVANRQLAYEATLDTYFTSISSVAETAQFKVINASRPKNKHSGDKYSIINRPIKTGNNTHVFFNSG